MLKDLKLNYGTKTVNNTFINGNELIIQSIVLALQCWLGDWYLNSDYGIDYENKLGNVSILIADMKEMILSCRGVTSVKNIRIKKMYENTNKTQMYVIVNADITLEDNEQVLFEELIPIVGY